jgi:putative ABC transport system ATP-binding protein
VSSPGARAAPSSAPAVVCERLSKVYPGARPVVALDAIDLAVSAGEFLAIVGPSGGGKSTLLHLVAGIDRSTSGSIRVGGRDIGSLSESELTLYRRREVGVVFQFFNLLPHLTVRENVELPRLLDGKKDAAIAARELLDRVDLTERADAHPYELSGGEMQRAAIARGNDGEQVLELLDDVRRERGVTLLLATHSQAAARRADRTVELRDGRFS